MTLLRLTDASYRYPRAQTEALHALRLELTEGSVFPIWGANASGKSTLARMLAETALGRRPSGMHGDVETSFAASGPGRLGIIFDDVNWTFCNLLVGEELAFGLEASGTPPREIEERVHETLSLIGLPGFAPRRISTLSGGEARRLAIGAVIITNPEIIVSDDITASLDADGLHTLPNILKDYTERNGAIWIDLRRRWTEFAAPEPRFGTMRGRTLHIATTARLAAREIEALAGQLGRPLAIELCALVNCVVPGALSSDAPPKTPTQLLDKLEALKLRLVSKTRPRVHRYDEPALGARGISYSYGQREPVLHDCGIAIQAGAVTALTGANGAGKSTLSRILCGLRRAQEGELFLLGRFASPRELIKRVSYVFQNPENQFLADSALEEVKLALRTEDGNLELRPPALDILDVFSLKTKAQVHPFNLGLGEKRRLALAVASARQSPILIVDEPTMAQDQSQVDSIAEHLTDAARRGVGVLVITHDTEFADAVSDYWFHLEGGRTREISEEQLALPDLSLGRSPMRELWATAVARGLTEGPPPRGMGCLEVQRRIAG